MNLIQILKLTSVVWALARKVDLTRIMDLPDTTDSADTRAWVRSVVHACSQAAAITPTQVDDQVVGAMTKIVDNDEAWTAMHALLIQWLGLADGAVGDDGPIYADACDQPQVAAIAGAAGVDPLTVIAIIQAVIQIIDWLRNRRAA